MYHKVDVRYVAPRSNGIWARALFLAGFVCSPPPRAVHTRPYRRALVSLNVLTPKAIDSHSLVFFFSLVLDGSLILLRRGVTLSPSSLSQEVIQVTPIKLPEGWSKPKAFYEANKIDFYLCSIMFWFMGGRVIKAIYRFPQAQHRRCRSVVVSLICWF